MIQNEFKNITPQKHRSFYRYFHPYFTRLPGNVVSEYVKNFSKPGDIVFDPFCGSGVVPIESIMLGRKALGSDLSPLAVFISQQLLNYKVSDKDIQVQFEKIEADACDLITKIWNIGGESIYSGKSKVLKNVLESYWYPKVKISYRSNFQSMEDLFDPRQLATYAVLNHHIEKIKNKNLKNTFKVALLGAMSRANLTYMVSSSRSGSVLHNGGSSLFSIYDYRKPKNLVVIPVWERFVRKVNDIKQVKKKGLAAVTSINSKEMMESSIFKADAMKLKKKVKPESVDYIFTDPPYGAKIPYLELASMWCAWMGWEISKNDFEAEIIEGGELKKTEDNYVEMLSKSISSMSDTLKVGGHLSIVFQHNKLSVWESIFEAARESNLQFLYGNIQPTSSSTIIKKKFKNTVVSVPMIINFKKTKKNIPKKKNRRNINWSKLEELVLKEFEKNDASPSYEDIYNALISKVFNKGFSMDGVEFQKHLSFMLEKYKIDSFL